MPTNFRVCIPVIKLLRLCSTITYTGGNISECGGRSPSLGFMSLESQTPKLKKKISMIKINERKPNKKQTIKKTKLINKVYKSTFNSINSVIFIVIICFDWRKQLFYISSLSLYFIVAITTFSIWILNLLWLYFFLPFGGVLIS